jgi:predicted MPP superfamily phosphohydrolase
MKAGIESVKASMPMNISRRKFLKVTLSVLGGAIASGPLAWLYATEVEPGWLEIERLSVPLAGLPQALAGFTVAHFSDLHLGPHMSRERALRVIEQVNACGAQAVIFSGDFVSQLHQGEGEAIVEAFSRLHAPGGVFAVLGNHDHWTDAEQVSDAAREAGVTVLRNKGLALQEGALWLAGVDDVWEDKQDLEAALDGAPEDAAIILLAHEPDFADEAAADGRVALQLSGHSHGGQVRLPFYGAMVLPNLGRKYPFGLRRVGPIWLYTNRGVGVVSPPVRFNCRPEVTLLTLLPA